MVDKIYRLVFIFSLNTCKNFYYFFLVFLAWNRLSGNFFFQKKIIVKHFSIFKIFVKSKFLFKRICFQMIDLSNEPLDQNALCLISFFETCLLSRHCFKKNKVVLQSFERLLKFQKRKTKIDFSDFIEKEIFLII